MMLYGYYLDAAAVNVLSGAIQIAALFMLIVTAVRVHNLAWSDWLHFPALAIFACAACLYIKHPLNQPGAGIGLTEMALLHLAGWLAKCGTDWVAAYASRHRCIPVTPTNFAGDLAIQSRG